MLYLCNIHVIELMLVNIYATELLINKSPKSQLLGLWGYKVLLLVVGKKGTRAQIRAIKGKW